MKGNKNAILAIIGIIIGVSGLCLGAFSLIAGGPQGEPGIDGQDGQDGTNGTDVTGTISVGILGLTEGDIISGNITVRAIVTGSNNYSVVLLVNSFPIVDYLPYTWDTSGASNVWMNITVVAIDSDSLEMTYDSINVFVDNTGHTNTYFCASESEINSALSSIGTGFGKIVITEDIALVGQIDLDGGGSYILEGSGLITISRPGDSSHIVIHNASSTIIRDLILNIDQAPGHRAMGVYEDNNNPVLIENVQIYGHIYETGILVGSDNVTISNCIFNTLSEGIYTTSNIGNVHIIDNYFESITNYPIYGGTNLHNSEIEGNFMTRCLDGIRLSNANNIAVSNNIINQFDRFGIYVDGNYSTFTGNVIYEVVDPFTNCHGFYITSSGHHNILTGNMVHSINPSTFLGYCVSIYGNENTLAGNSFFNNDYNEIQDYGTGNIILEDAGGPNTYYCSSESEINSAISSIGTAFGKIIITEDIALVGQIYLDGGGSYILEGSGLVTISRPGDSNHIVVHDASSTIIRDLILNIDQAPGDRAIGVYEANDNPVLIENIQIYGNKYETGILVGSDNVTISNCIFNTLSEGIYTTSNVGNLQIIGNWFESITNYPIYGGTNLHNSLIDGNTITRCLDGIRLSSSNSIIVSNNIINQFGRIAIFVDGMYSIFTGNVIYEVVDPFTTCYGFYITSSGDYNIFTGNIVHSVNPPIYSAYCFWISGDENTVTGNAFFNNKNNIIQNTGTGNVITGNNEG